MTNDTSAVDAARNDLTMSANVLWFHGLHHSKTEHPLIVLQIEALIRAIVASAQNGRAES